MLQRQLSAWRSLPIVMENIMRLWNFPIKLVNIYFTDNKENGMDQKEIE